MGNSNPDAALAAADVRVAEALAADLADEPASFEEAVQRVRACVTANHANTLPLLACLRAVPEPTPYREAADAVDALPVRGLSTQNAYVLFDLLEKSGGVRAIPVAEPAVVPGPASDEPVSSAGVESASIPAPADPAPAPAPASLPDQPVDHLLVITETGRAVLDEFEPSRRLAALLEEEPAGYADAYGRVLDLCSAPEGASRAEVEEALAGHPALRSPKQIYPNYFISKLETVDGISWDGRWHATESGLRLRALAG